MAVRGMLFYIPYFSDLSWMKGNGCVQRCPVLYRALCAEKRMTSPVDAVELPRSIRGISQ